MIAGKTMTDLSQLVLEHNKLCDESGINWYHKLVSRRNKAGKQIVSYENNPSKLATETEILERIQLMQEDIQATKDFQERYAQELNKILEIKTKFVEAFGEADWTWLESHASLLPGFRE